MFRFSPLLFSWLAVVVALQLQLITTEVTAQQQQQEEDDDCNACLFDGNDPTSCVVYGRIDDDTVVEWNTGSRDCKGYWGIAISSVDPTTSCQSTNAFVASLRLGDLQSSTSKLGLGVASEGGSFFVQTTNNNNRIEVTDSITIDGITTDCTNSEFTCYTKMNSYFEVGAGAQEKDQVCATLANKVLLDRNLEESTLRIRLCMEQTDGAVIPLECNPLAIEVASKMAEYPNKACSAYGLESLLSKVPGCESTAADLASSSGSGSAGSSSNNSSSSNSGTSGSIATINNSGMSWIMGTACVSLIWAFLN